MRAYFFTWLLSAFAIISASLFDYTRKAGAHLPQESGLAGAFLFGAICGLLSLPTLFLLRVVPENSPSSGVRIVRRLLIGMLCGLLLAGLLAAAIAASGKADENTEKMLAPVGAIFGLIAGLVDSIALDDPAEPRGDDDGEAGAGGSAG